MDTTTPTISSFSENGGDSSYKDGDTLTIDVNMDSIVDVASGVNLTLSNGQTAQCGTGSGVTNFTCTYTIEAAHQNTSALNVTAINNAANITDMGSNPADSGLPSAPNDLASQTIIIDTTPPSPPSSLSFTASSPTNDGNIAISFSPGADSHLDQHIAKVCTNSDCSTGCEGSGTSSSSSITVSVSTDGLYYGCVAATDTAGNQSSFQATSSPLEYDSTVPSVIQVTSSSPSGSYKLGDNLTISVQMSEIVTVNSPSGTTLFLETGAADRQASYVSASGDTIHFQYVVQEGDESSDLDYSSSTALTLGGSTTIQDASGNPANLSLPSPGAAGSLSANESLIIDGIIPVVTVNSSTEYTTKPGLSGTIDDSSASVSVTVGSETVTATVPGDGSWLVAQGELNHLLNGTYDVVVTATDQAGNAGTDSSTDELIVDAPRFITTWNTGNAGTSGTNEIQLPLLSGGTYDFIVDWGDGSSDVITSDSDTNKTHTYASQGSYDVKISGTINGFSFQNTGDVKKITDIKSWGPLKLGNGGSYFRGASNLIVTATDVLDLTETTNLYGAFDNCTSLTTIPNINSWDVSNVTTMQWLFRNTPFNSDISNWDLSSLTDMSGLFLNANQFNQDISSWDTSQVQAMIGVFKQASNFNQDISNWNTSSVTTMAYMFQSAGSFNQDISSWEVSQVTDMTGMFQGVTLSRDHYNNLLMDWASQDVQSNVTFHGGYSTYSGGDPMTARNELTGTHNWTINDGGADLINLTVGTLPTVTSSNQSNYTLSGTCSYRSFQSMTITGDVTVGTHFSSEPSCGLLPATWSKNLNLYSFADGDIDVTITYTDTLLNDQAVKYVTLTKDTAPPVINGFSINGGDPYTNSSPVTLSIDASDTTAMMMLISNSSDCSSGTYELYSSSKSWSLPNSNSSNTISIKLKDSVGQETGCQSASIIHDDTSPAPPTVTTPTEDETINDLNTVTIQWDSVSDANFKEYKIFIDRSGSFTSPELETATTGTSYSLTGLTATEGTFNVCVKALDQAGNSSDCGTTNFYFVEPPQAVQNLSSGGSLDHVVLFWEDSSQVNAGYLVVAGPDSGTSPAFSPAPETDYSEGAQGPDKIIFVGLSKRFVHKLLKMNHPHSYKVFAYNSRYQYSDFSELTQISPANPCSIPGREDWVWIPADPHYGTPAHCVMRYEAKDGFAQIRSQPTNTPLVNITLFEARSQCRSLGMGYSLINHDQWLVTAGQIALEPSNWSNGALGDSQLSQGHHQGSPNNLLYVSDPSNPCDSILTETSCGTWNSQMRRHRILTGDVIWDISGNAFEFTDYVNDSDYSSGSDIAFSSFSSTATLQLSGLILTQNKVPDWQDSWNAPFNRVGTYNSSGGTGTKVLRRGGSYGWNSSSVGIFAADISFGQSASDSKTGFRCVKTVPDNAQASSGFTISYEEGSLKAKWSHSGASGYLLVAGDEHYPPAFMPENSVYYSQASEGPDNLDFVFTPSTSTPIDIEAEQSISPGLSKRYELFSYDSVPNYISLGVVTERKGSCPSDFSFVNGRKILETDDFCVMTHEAYEIGGNINLISTTPSSLGTLKSNIPAMDAARACKALGVNYELIDNNQWVTLASELAGIPSNWTGGTIGAGMVYRGHSDNSRSMACPSAGELNTAYLEGSDCSEMTSDDDQSQRRYHTLSSGDVIWDISGNLREWVDYYVDLKPVSSTQSGYVELNSVSDFGSMSGLEFFPKNIPLMSSWQASEGMGQYKAGSGGQGYPVRGGGFSENMRAGLFALDLSNGSGNSSDIGFRCVLNAPLGGHSDRFLNQSVFLRILSRGDREWGKV